MWTLWAIFVTSFTVALSGALMPGPLLTVTIGESPRRGARTGPLLVAGHGLLELALVSAVFWGAAPYLNQRAVVMAIALAGAVILLWMAWGMFRALPRLSLTSTGQGGAGRSLVATGILMSLANPYWTIWWVTIGLNYIIRSQPQGIWGVLCFFVGHILADFVWYTAVSTAMSKGRHLLTDRIYRILTGACAACLVLFAGLFLYGACTAKGGTT
jgi:threonine/homoserine/homoserine lactone efflux protein